MVRTTAVIGAGPAGLLFTLIGKITMGDAWNVTLYDKRATYQRTHRLRMAPEPYLAIQRALDDARFDALMTFLQENHFSPEVNLLEAKLTELLDGLGVRKVVREITSLAEIDADVIVGADSVHSTVRDLVRGAIEPEKHTHERIARLRVTGPDLPHRLSVVDQYRLSKVLGSVVDYRVNRNGFAEIDLFLTEAEHAIVRDLGATPKDPVAIDSQMLAKMKAPLFRAIVEHLEHGERRIVVQSTFQLEHAVMPRVSFSVAGKRVFLVGDAAVSLPFFRGMACLASCAHALARAHASGHLDDYEREVAAIVHRELGVVRARAHLVRGLRELIRVSALLPFPIQSWWLSAGRDPLPDRISPSGWFNVLIAASAASLVVLGAISPALALLSLPIQLAGGVAYRWTLELEPGPHRHLRRIWEVQIFVVGAIGVALAIARRLPWFAAVGWLVLGAAFALGIYVFEWFVAARLRRARLEEH